MTLSAEHENTLCVFLDDLDINPWKLTDKAYCQKVAEAIKAAIDGITALKKSVDGRNEIITKICESLAASSQSLLEASRKNARLLAGADHLANWVADLFDRNVLVCHNDEGRPCDRCEGEVLLEAYCQALDGKTEKNV